MKKKRRQTTTTTNDDYYEMLDVAFAVALLDVAFVCALDFNDDNENASKRLYCVTMKMLKTCMVLT